MNLKIWGILDLFVEVSLEIFLSKERSDYVVNNLKAPLQETVRELLCVTLSLYATSQICYDTVKKEGTLCNM